MEKLIKWFKKNHPGWGVVKRGDKYNFVSPFVGSLFSCEWFVSEQEARETIERLKRECAN